MWISSILLFWGNSGSLTWLANLTKAARSSGSIPTLYRLPIAPCNCLTSSHGANIIHTLQETLIALQDD